jgi:hypothetical protein
LRFATVVSGTISRPVLKPRGLMTTLAPPSGPASNMSIVAGVWLTLAREHEEKAIECINGSAYVVNYKFELVCHGLHDCTAAH